MAGSVFPGLHVSAALIALGLGGACTSQETSSDAASSPDAPVVEVDGLGSFYITDPEDTIQRRLATGARWEPYLAALIEGNSRPGTVAIDAGAHIGTHTLAMANAVGPKGKVYAFEPNPDAVVDLRNNLVLNDVRNVEVVVAALGAERSEGFMKISPKNNTGGTHACTTGNLQRGELGCEDQTNASAPFVMMTLDELDLSNVSLIKIDVEGHEAGLIQGARETIRASKPLILVEVWSDEKRKAEGLPTTQREVLESIRSLGYAVTAVARWDYLAIPIGLRP